MNSKSCLVVSGDPLVRSQFRTMVQSCGVQALEAAGAAQMMHCIEQYDPDAILFAEGESDGATAEAIAKLPAKGSPSWRPSMVSGSSDTAMNAMTEHDVLIALPPPHLVDMGTFRERLRDLQLL